MCTHDHAKYAPGAWDGGRGSEDNLWCLSMPSMSFKTFLVHASCTRLAGM